MTSPPTPERRFPFSAVVGQDRLKTALVLAAIHPGIGGVLITGPRGSAKSTLARGLADLEAGGGERFVTLPLGATEEQVVGTLDLQQALDGQQVRFQPGLLAKAHGGVLYIDEVNLLADPLVDVLLDVAACGVNRVERDGISHSHAAEFLLIGTMNPDEGDLRPQLKDRFGLAVELGNRYGVAERRAIVEQRLAFERDPEGFVAAHEPAQRELDARIRAARAAVGSVVCPQPIQETIAERCIEADVEGLRADLHWRQAASAHAAWQGRDHVSEGDVEAVAELVLCHRRRADSDPPPGTAAAPPSAGGDSAAGGRDPGAGDWGAMPPREVAPLGRHAVVPERLAGPEDAPHAAPATETRHSRERAPGPGPGHHHPDPRRRTVAGARVDWFRTLAAPENRDGHGLRVLRHRPARSGRNTLNCVVLDTSASTLSREALAHAKAVVLAIAASAYRAREQLAILAFGNDRVDWIVSPRRAPKDCGPQLARLPAGGGTPLRQALLAARRTLKHLTRQQPALRCRTLLLTDGRSRDHVADLPWPSPLCVLDMERARVPLRRCRGLARELGGHYVRLDAAVAPE